MIMRKFLTVCTCSLIAVFSVSCSMNKNSESISTADIQDCFICDAVINYGELQANSSVKRYGKGMWENEFISPDTVAGVKLVFNNDEVTASYKGLEFSVPKSAMPFQSMLCCLIEAADNIYESQEITGSQEDGVICYEGTLEQGDYTICFNSETGFIQSFEMPNMELTMEFTNCSVNNSQNISTDTATVTEANTAEEIPDEEATSAETGAVQ